jgi:diadenosine tetraphosphatase ApaH/serine/threonine PP2A family protein phosphatase
LIDLAERALGAGYEEFRGIIGQGLALLEEERRRGGWGDVVVDGGLITLPDRGRLLCIGDLHGDLESLSLILERADVLGRLKTEPLYLIFLGDYGDRGRFSPEVYYVAFYLKLLHRERVFLLRGNHEGPHDVPFYPYDLPQSFRSRFGRVGESLLGQVRRAWNSLHHAAIVPGKYCILHGGVPTEAGSLAEVARAHEEHPRKPHLVEILWNDPREGIRGAHASARGIGKYFGKDLTERFLQMTGARTLIRGHEVCMGVKTNHENRILTVFSCREPYGIPEAAWLEVDLSVRALDAGDLAASAHFI